MPGPEWFSPNSTDEIISKNLHDGDVLLINKRCTSFTDDPLRAILCLASKYGISGDGRAAWDHAAMVIRKNGVPYLLEGEGGGVTLRTFEERLLQSTDHQEVLLLPLRGADDSDDAKRQRSGRLGRFVDELGLQRTPDGFDSPGTCCQNTWDVYRTLRGQRRAPSAVTGDVSTAASGICRFGAPLIAAALQHAGALGVQFDASSVTPSALAALPLEPPASFGKPVPLRSMQFL